MTGIRTSWERSPALRWSTRGLNRRVVGMEDGVLLGFGPRTPLVIDILVDRVHREGRAS
ncbi:hypothetical protein P1P75_04800 [Streptomyces sp. ID05-39B]|uniref:hypothetical protein n=1 Tax=Streptomyces sp. ID05-39B TaxID=3028664 RepID=UPI0029BE0341|nr:hypothetical protein [Streptomyces sp. ID05-39B]MDX3525770.1 hypothetical protein [Streptomyces sp. ID05-39B]